MAVAVVMGEGKAKVVQNSPKPKATTGSVAEVVGVWYGGTVVELYDLIPCWRYTGTEFEERECAFESGENFQIFANIVQNKGTSGYIYFDLCYYDEYAKRWVSIGGGYGAFPGPMQTDTEVPHGCYAVYWYDEDADNYVALNIGGSPMYGCVIIVPGKYRTYELDKTHYFGFKAWGEDEEEPTLPTPV